MSEKFKYEIPNRGEQDADFEDLVEEPKELAEKMAAEIEIEKRASESDSEKCKFLKIDQKYEQPEWEKLKIKLDPLYKFWSDRGIDPADFDIKYELVYVAEQKENGRSGTSKKLSNYHDFLKTRNGMNDEMKAMCDSEWNRSEKRWKSPQAIANNNLIERLKQGGDLNQYSEDFYKLYGEVLGEKRADEFAQAVLDGKAEGMLKGLEGANASAEKEKPKEESPDVELEKRGLLAELDGIKTRLEELKGKGKTKSNKDKEIKELRKNLERRKEEIVVRLKKIETPPPTTAPEPATAPTPDQIEPADTSPETGEPEERKKGFWDKSKEILSNREIQKQVGKTLISTVASVFGFKSIYDVPAYFKQKFDVTGLGMGKGIEGSMEDLMSASQNGERRKNPEFENESLIKSKEVRDAIDDLNRRLKSTKEGTQKNSGQRDLIAKMLWENRQKEKMLKEERHAEITKILDDYTTTKVTGIQAIRESLNTAFVASGAFAFRGLSYGALAVAERGQRIKREASQKKEKLENVEFLKKVFVDGVKETFQEAAFSGEGAGSQKAIKAIKAYGSLARFIGIGATMEFSPDSFTIDKVLNTLEGKTGVEDIKDNFVGNFERLVHTPERIKNLAHYASSRFEGGNQKMSQPEISSNEKLSTLPKGEASASSNNELKEKLWKPSVVESDAFQTEPEKFQVENKSIAELQPGKSDFFKFDNSLDASYLAELQVKNEILGKFISPEQVQNHPEIFKNFAKLTDGHSILKVAQIQEKGNVSEALGLVMSKHDVLTIVNPDGTIITDFDANLVHPGDTVVQLDDEIVILKTSGIDVNKETSFDHFKNKAAQGNAEGRNEIVGSGQNKAEVNNKADDTHASAETQELVGRENLDKDIENKIDLVNTSILKDSRDISSLRHDLETLKLKPEEARMYLDNIKKIMETSRNIYGMDIYNQELKNFVNNYHIPSDSPKNAELETGTDGQISEEINKNEQWKIFNQEGSERREREMSEIPHDAIPVPPKFPAFEDKYVNETNAGRVENNQTEIASKEIPVPPKFPPLDGENIDYDAEEKVNVDVPKMSSRETDAMEKQTDIEDKDSVGQNLIEKNNLSLITAMDQQDSKAVRKFLIDSGLKDLNIKNISFSKYDNMSEIKINLDKGEIAIREAGTYEEGQNNKRIFFDYSDGNEKKTGMPLSKESLESVIHGGNAAYTLPSSESLFLNGKPITRDGNLIKAFGSQGDSVVRTEILPDGNVLVDNNLVVDPKTNELIKAMSESEKTAELSEIHPAKIQEESFERIKALLPVKERNQNIDEATRLFINENFSNNRNIITNFKKILEKEFKIKDVYAQKDLYSELIGKNNLAAEYYLAENSRGNGKQALKQISNYFKYALNQNSASLNWDHGIRLSKIQNWTITNQFNPDKNY